MYFHITSADLQIQFSVIQEEVFHRLPPSRNANYVEYKLLYICVIRYFFIKNTEAYSSHHAMSP